MDPLECSAVAVLPLSRPDPQASPDVAVAQARPRPCPRSEGIGGRGVAAAPRLGRGRQGMVETSCPQPQVPTGGEEPGLGAPLTYLSSHTSQPCSNQAVLTDTREDGARGKILFSRVTSNRCSEDIVA